PGDVGQAVELEVIVRRDENGKQAFVGKALSELARPEIDFLLARRGRPGAVEVLIVEALHQVIAVLLAADQAGGDADAGHALLELTEPERAAGLVGSAAEGRLERR